MKLERIQKYPYICLFDDSFMEFEMKWNKMYTNYWRFCLWSPLEQKVPIIGDFICVSPWNKKCRLLIYDYVSLPRYRNYFNSMAAEWLLSYSFSPTCMIRVQNMNPRPSLSPKYGKMPIRVTDLASDLCVLYVSQPMYPTLQRTNTQNSKTNIPFLGIARLKSEVKDKRQSFRGNRQGII